MRTLRTSDPPEEERLRQICRDTCAYLVPMPDEQRLGWWGDEAKTNAEARAVAEARKRFDAAAVKPEGGPIPAPPSVPPRPWKPVRELKIIDPACGSAHFLLYVFDVLRRMYEIEPKADRPTPPMCQISFSRKTSTASTSTCVPASSGRSTST